VKAFQGSIGKNDDKINGTGETMSKRSKSGFSQPDPRVETINIGQLIAKAVDRSPGKFLYANHAQFVVSDKEVSIDLFFVGLSHASEVEAVFLQRIVIPHALAKGFATGLANAIASFEAGQGVILPNQRQPFPDDKITIWP
jgi:hypothetical protein